MRRLLAWFGALALAPLPGCAPGEREAPALAVMASVPLLRGEGDIAAQIDGSARPMQLKALLERDWRLVPLDDVGALAKLDPHALLMVQPRALRPVELVALDAWVRSGGRLLLIVDPALVWPSELPLGDRRRPLFATMLSPLLERWGLELQLPVGEPPESQRLELGGARFPTAMPGLFVQTRTPGKADCRLADGGAGARCVVGRGQAVLVADADFLDDRRWPAGLLGTDAAAGEAVADLLRSMKSRDGTVATPSGTPAPP